MQNGRSCGSIAALGLCWLMAGCDSRATGQGERPTREREAPARPNILWVVWDTVRRDHMSVYGYGRRTTPFLESWAWRARVYDNCVSPGSTTVPSHASMFTGLMPSEHGASNEHPQLDERFDTFAELLKRSGYDTYLFSANPFLCDALKFTQGFDRAEHPWSPVYRERAIEIVRSRIDPRDRSSSLPQKLRSGRISAWAIKAAGELAQVGVERWLDSRTGDQPFFIFLNYMEAHHPLVPAMEYRRQMMSEEEILKSFQVDRDWSKAWAYTFGAAEYTEEELMLTNKTYDAALLELDDLFGRLIESLERRGALQDTIVVLTSDHGEHLGEHHMLEHQYSLYDVVLEVPLLVCYPKAFEPGRDSRPVMSFDLFPTLLRLAGLPQPARSAECMDLADVPAQRLRLSEYPEALRAPFQTVGRTLSGPSGDRTRWLRSLRALTDSPLKLICGSDGSRELYDTAADPGELANLADAQADRWAEQCRRLQHVLGRLTARGPREALARMDREQVERLRALGYVGDVEEEEEAPPPDRAGAAVTNFCSCESP